jgi:hypothetical protein
MHEALDTTCDDLFLIIATARHNGFEIDTKEIIEHIEACRECQERNDVS